MPDPEFPLESFGPHMEDILQYGVDLLNLYDEQRFLWVIAAFALTLMVISWAIKQIRNPPNLDI
jgi:hypothetical protein